MMTAAPLLPSKRCRTTTSPQHRKTAVVVFVASVLPSYIHSYGIFLGLSSWPYIPTMVLYKTPICLEPDIEWSCYEVQQYILLFSKWLTRCSCSSERWWYMFYGSACMYASTEHTTHTWAGWCPREIRFFRGRVCRAQSKSAGTIYM